MKGNTQIAISKMMKMKNREKMYLKQGEEPFEL
jgi:hypothetical protein